MPPPSRCSAPGSPAVAQPPSPWGARAPATWAPLTKPAVPTAAEAAQLVRCAKDSASTSTGDLWLAERVVVKLGAAKPFRDMFNIYTMSDAGTTKAVVPITGSWTWSNCILTADAARSGNAGKTCTETDVTAKVGRLRGHARGRLEAQHEWQQRNAAPEDAAAEVEERASGRGRISAASPAPCTCRSAWSVARP